MTNRRVVTSPDGRTLVYVATSDGKTQLWLRPLDSESARPLAGTDGALFPFWSPDSRSVGFFAVGQLKRIDLASGLVQNLAEAPLNSRGGSWNQEGTILFTRSATEPLYRVSASGGKAVVATTLRAPHLGHRFPQFLPDGKRFLFFAFGPPASQGIYAGSLDSSETTRLIEAESAPVFVPPDYVMFTRDGAVLAQRLDTATMRPIGSPIAVATRVVTPTGTVGIVALSASPAGVIAYRSDAGERRQRWVDRTGKTITWAGAPHTALQDVYRLSPDARNVAAARMTDGNLDVWIVELERDVRRRLTTNRAREYDPTWSPDGRRIVFGSTRQGVVDLFVRSVAGTAPESLLLASGESKNALDWSADGKWLLFATQSAVTARDIWVLPMEGEKKPIPVVQTAFEETGARFSPDGRWIAYHSNESGRNEVYIQTFPGGGTRRQFSTSGGTNPQWSRDGKALFYRSLDNQVMSVPVALEAGGEPGAAVALFALAPGATFQAAPDGQRFLIDEVLTAPSPITILLNWRPADE